MERPVVLVARRDDIFSSMLRDAGCEVVNLELIRTEPAEDLKPLDRILDRIEDYDGLFFTSPAAAEVFVERFATMGRNFRGKIYVVGKTAKTLLENSGFKVVPAANANTAESLISSFDEAEFAGRKLLFVRGTKSLRIILDRLSDKADVDEVIVYETKEVSPDESVVRTITERLMKGEVDWICFFSPSGVQAFRRLFASVLFGTTSTAAIGETTAVEARKLNFCVHVVSNRPDAEFFAARLIEFIKTN